MCKRVSFIIKDVVNSSLIYIFITFFSWTCKTNFNIDIQYLCIILKNKSADWLSELKQVLRNPSHYWPRLALLFPEIRCQYRQSKASSSCFLLILPQHFYIPQLPACLYSKNINFRDPSEPHTNCMHDHNTVKHCPWGCVSSSLQKLANRKWPNTIILEHLPWCRNQAWSLLLPRLPRGIEPRSPFKGWNSVLVQ